jgi:SAM-dependent methyltransferase
MSDSWKDFWEDYRRIEAKTEDDLFVQVGRTIGRRPVIEPEFVLEMAQVDHQLDPQADDIVLEYCCGNGLVCYQLAPRVHQVIGIDFTARLIDAARHLRSRANIEYHVRDIREPLADLLGPRRPTRFLMVWGLAYLTPDDLDRVLRHTVAVRDPSRFCFLATGIPDVELQSNFYDTPERRARHLENQARGDEFNDGMGRWWSRAELHEAARRHGLSVKIESAPAKVSNYRMDALFS